MLFSGNFLLRFHLFRLFLTEISPFQVIFPTVDVLSDLSLAGRLWRGQDEGIVRRSFGFEPLVLGQDVYDQVSNFLDKLANFPCPRTKIFRIFFGFQIVLYGGCDGGSCKKNQKSQCFVHFLIFLMVRE